MKKNILIIGSNSFSGSNMINLLLSKDFKVVGTSRSPQPHKVFLPYYKSPKIKNFTFHKIDLNTNLKKLINIIDGFKPNYIVNFASQSMVAESWLSPLDWYNTNVISQIKLIEYLRYKKFIRKFIQISTPEVYGKVQGNINPTNIYLPSTPYAISRAAFDMHLEAYYKNYNFPVVFTRAANVYGPHQQLYRIIPRTIMFAKMGLKLKLDGGGKSKRSFININDVSTATMKILKKGKLGHVYHISNDEIISIKNLVKKICMKINVNFNNFVEVSPDRMGKDNEYNLNYIKLKNELNWESTIKLEEGLNQTIQWIDRNFNTLKKQNLYYKHKK